MPRCSPASSPTRSRSLCRAAAASPSRWPNGRSARRRATAGVVKDAGDDPDVTHGALVRAQRQPRPPGDGIIFRAGPGVGTVTRPGLPLPPGEPAINPVPRADDPRRTRRTLGPAPDVVVEISIPGGETLAQRTLNGAARHRRRAVDPRHHRHRRAVFLLRLDRQHPSRHRRRARHRPARISPAPPAAPPRRRCARCTAARDRADRHGRFRRRHAEISAHPSGAARHRRRRRRENDQAGARAARSAFQARRGRFFCHCRPRRAATGPAPRVAARIAARQYHRAGFRASQASPLGDAVAARAWACRRGGAATGAETELEIVLFDRTGALVGRAQFAPVHARNRRR